MKIDIERYSVNRPAIKAWIENNNYTNLKDEISVMAVTTGVPIVVVVEYVMEVVGRTPELLAFQDRLKIFYNY